MLIIIMGAAIQVHVPVRRKRQERGIGWASYKEGLLMEKHMKHEYLYRVLVLAICLAGATTAVAQIGQMDYTFGTDGVVFTDFGVNPADSEEDPHAIAYYYSGTELGAGTHAFRPIVLLGRIRIARVADLTT